MSAMTHIASRVRYDDSYQAPIITDSTYTRHTIDFGGMPSPTPPLDALFGPGAPSPSPPLNLDALFGPGAPSRKSTGY
jgi:hypothetical protein